MGSREVRDAVHRPTRHVVGGVVIHLVTVLLGALLADRFRQKSAFVAGAALVVLGAFPFYWLVDTAQPVLILLGFALVLLALAAILPLKTGRFDASWESSR